MVQIMMAAGMMGVLSLGLMKMMENQRLSHKSAKASSEALSFYQEIKGYLSKSSYCSKNFEGEVLNEGDKFEFEEILKPNGKVLFKVGDIIGDRALKISKMEVINFEKDSETSGIMKVRFSLAKIGKSYGASSFLKIVKLDVSLDEKSAVVSCATLGSLSQSAVSLGGNAEGSQKLENVEEALSDLNKGKNTQRAKDLQKAIDGNNELKQMQKSLEALHQSNKEMEKLLEE